MNIIGAYSISNVRVQVECEENFLSKKVSDAFDDYFYMTKGDYPPITPTITLRFENNNNSTIKIPNTAEELFTSYSFHVLKDGDFCYLITGSSLFQLDPRNSLGIALLDSTFWEGHPRSRQEALMLSILWLVRLHGLYALHANGVVKDTIGILIVGDSGSGKSTTALKLIRQGCGYLSDDVTLIAQTSDGIEAIAFPKGFSLDSQLANCFPEFKAYLEPSSDGEKQFMDIRRAYSDGFQSSCFPRVLIFPEIVSNHGSTLIPIDRTKALILLAENSGGVMVDKDMVVKQMEVLKRLVFQTTSYQLFAGRDLHEEPERISEILSRVEVIPGCHCEE